MSNKIRKVKSKRYQLQCQIFSCEVFTSSVGKIASEVLLQGFDLLDRKSDASCNSLRRYAFWLKTPYTGYGTLVETPDFRQYNKNRRIEAWIGRFGSVFVHELSLFHGCLGADRVFVHDLSRFHGC